MFHGKVFLLYMRGCTCNVCRYGSFLFVFRQRLPLEIIAAPDTIIILRAEHEVIDFSWAGVIFFDVSR